MEIKEWISSSNGDYHVGLELLKQHKASKVVLSILSKGETVYNRIRLTKELKKLAVKSTPPKQPKRKATPSAPVVWLSGKLSKIHYPSALHPAVDRIEKLYAFVNHYHPLLDSTYHADKGQCFAIATGILDAWHEIEEIWRLLNYYQENQVVLPNKYNPEDIRPPLDRAALMKRRSNLRTYISKHRYNKKRAIDVQEWRAELSEIEKKLGDVI